MSEEKRPDARFELDIIAYMDDVEMTVRNLSVSGIQLVCPGEHVGNLSEDLMISLVHVKFSLPGDVDIETRCAVVYLQEYQGEHLLGLKFTQFMGESFTRLTEFVHRRERAMAQERK